MKTVVCLLLLFTWLPAAAKEKKAKAQPGPAAQDEIELVGQIPAGTEPVTQFLLTQHHSSYYLYVEHAAGKSVTIIDITKLRQPVLVAESQIPGDAVPSFYAVAGTTALVMEGVAPAAVGASRTVRIVNYADPKKPVLVRSFSGVTATGRDSRRGLIFLANSEGIWILQQRYASDPELDKAYEHHVLYDR